MVEADQQEGERRTDAEDVEPVEVDPEGRYHRYLEVVGRGKFKSCHKAFDSQIGIDVAWSKYNADSINLSDAQLESLVSDIQTNVHLEHPNIIKSFKCWEDSHQHCINLVTELFTSGNLRQFRSHYPQLDLKAVKRMARQILRGLEYLHGQDITHGDLRCDKIYVNGNSGEIKIGDIGLATLVPYRWEGAERPPQLLDASFDIFAFGLCMLELLTLKHLDPQHCQEWEELLEDVQDESAKAFITKCLSTPSPAAEELFKDPFLSLPPRSTMNGEPGQLGSQADLSLSMPANTSTKSLPDILASIQEKRKTDDSTDEPGPTAAPIAVGKLRGEDYMFEFGGKVKDGKMLFRLQMQAVQEADDGSEPFKRTIDFVFDPEVDTTDNLAAEISEQFNLSPTDTEICAAALREWLAKEMPEFSEGREHDRA